jgi:hypothetical protein
VTVTVPGRGQLLVACARLVPSPPESRVSGPELESRYHDHHDHPSPYYLGVVTQPGSGTASEPGQRPASELAAVSLAAT